MGHPQVVSQLVRHCGGYLNQLVPGIHGNACGILMGADRCFDGLSHHAITKGHASDQLGIVVFMLGVNAVFSVVQESLQSVVGLGLYLEIVLLPNLNSHQSYVDI